jgi:tRNA A-37 threonylcarbamoyl transferase component Bud32
MTLNSREEILHKDICSANIVLDGLNNARLIDFGLARCADDVTTTNTERCCYHHSEVGKAPASKKWDYYALGVGR